MAVERKHTSTLRGGAEGRVLCIVAEEEARAPAYGAYNNLQAYHGSDWVTQEAKPKVERLPTTRAPNAAEQVIPSQASLHSACGVCTSGRKSSLRPEVSGCGIHAEGVWRHILIFCVEKLCTWWCACTRTLRPCRHTDEVAECPSGHTW